MITNGLKLSGAEIGGNPTAGGIAALAFGLFADLLEFFEGLLEADSQAFSFGDELSILVGDVVCFLHGLMDR